MLLVVQLFVLAHVAIPWPPIAMASKRSFIKFHPIKKNVLYRLWNPVSNGLIKKDPEDLTTVYCSGAFDTADANNSKPNLSTRFLLPPLSFRVKSTGMLSLQLGAWA